MADGEQKVKLGDNIEISSVTLDLAKTGLLELYKNEEYALRPTKLRYTNGSEGYGVTFSSAFCSVDPVVTSCFPFGTIFENGMRILNQCLKNETASLAKEEMEMCKKLLNYLDSDEAPDFFLKLCDDQCPVYKNETVLSVALAEHFLKMLTLKENYMLDHRGKKTDGDEICKCGCGHTIKDRFKDTSIGHKMVWHGYVDIVIGCGEQMVPVSVFPPDTEGPNNGAIPDEVNLFSANKKMGEAENQIIAQTIVFSFLQIQKYPSANHFLFPTIGICSNEVIFYFYDAENDVLLQSDYLPLYKLKGGFPFISYGTIIAVWFVLNYKYLGSGLIGSLKQTQKSNFLNLSCSMLQVYKEQLSFGNESQFSASSKRLNAYKQDLEIASCFAFPPDLKKVKLDCLDE